MKKMTKALLAVCCSILLSYSVVANSTSIKVIVNGAEVELENEPVIKKNGYIYLSVKDIANALNFEIKEYPDKQLINIKNDDLIVGVQANNKQYSKKRADGKVLTYQFSDESIPMMVDGNIYVPTGDFISVLEGRVNWDDKNKSYIIMNDWDVNYSTKKSVSIYAGTGEKGTAIGETATDTQLTYPQNIHTTQNNTTYIIDAGRLKIQEAGKIRVYDKQPENTNVSTVKGIKDEVYVLGVPNKTSFYYGLYKIERDGFKKVYTGNAKENRVLDFEIVNKDIICLLKEEIKTGDRYLEMVSLTSKFKTYKISTTNDTTCITGNNNKIYLGKKNGSIYEYDILTKNMSNFAGVEDEHGLRDGEDPLFCSPRKLEYYNGNLYILDFNMIRRISLDLEGNPGMCITVAGKVTGVNGSQMSSGEDSNLMMSYTNPLDISVGQDGVLITDPTQYKIMRIY